jgi:HPt (histidine-containing phosphotransfer) domain-containing protein
MLPTADLAKPKMPHKRKHFLNPRCHSRLRVAVAASLSGHRTIESAKVVPAKQTAEEPLDLSVLRRLQALQRAGEPDIVDALIALFFANARPILRDLEHGVEADDRDLVEQASHALASVAANMGARVLAGRCRKLSQLARVGQLADATERVKVIGDEYQRAEGALLSYSAQKAKAA